MKKLLALLLAAVMVCSMAACGGGTESNMAPTSADSQTSAAEAADISEAPVAEETPDAASSEETSTHEIAPSAEDPAQPAGVYGEDLPLSDLIAGMAPTELPITGDSLLMRSGWPLPVRYHRRRIWLIPTRPMRSCKSAPG